MLEMAIDSLNQNIDLWIIQCDDGFTRQLESSFGAENFYQFPNATENKGLLQIKKDRKDKTRVRADRCNTMVLDLEKALLWLLMHNPDEPYHMLGEYSLSRLSPEIRLHIENKLEQMMLPTSIIIKHKEEA